MGCRETAGLSSQAHLHDHKNTGIEAERGKGSGGHTQTIRHYKRDTERRRVQGEREGKDVEQEM